MITHSCKEIGGYFSIDIRSGGIFPEDVIPLNIARNCLRYVIRVNNIKKIWVPYYTCPVVWESIKKEDCEMNFYHINKSFLPQIKFGENDFILYTNYFGICANNVKLLAKKYKNLIVDNAQAYYMPHNGLASFNSARKFFGVPDGAFLYSKKRLKYEFEIDKSSVDRFSHLLKRIDTDASFGYEDFRNNDEALRFEDIKLMSNITKALIKGHDIETEKQKRLENFNYLHSKLKGINELIIELDEDDIPMIYPLFIKKDELRDKLIKNKIYVAKYWDGIQENIEEQELLNYLLPLPIDQRYNVDDMEYMAQLILNKIGELNK